MSTLFNVIVKTDGKDDTANRSYSVHLEEAKTDGGEHGLAGEDVVAGAVAEVDIAEDDGDHDFS